MADVILVAASGLAREVLAVIRSVGHDRVIGFLDDDESKWGTMLSDLPILGGIGAAEGFSGAQLLLCTGKGAHRESIARRLGALGYRDDDYATVVHESVEVPPTCSVGRGSILLAGVVLTTEVTVARHVVAMPHVTLTHDNVIGSFVTLCAGTTLGGGVTVGERAYLGMSSSVREGVHIGADAVLGMGAVLTRDMPSAETWYGVPARPDFATSEIPR